MSLALTSIRIIAHTSVMAGAPALFIGASKLSQTVLRPLGRSSFSTVAQQKAPKAVIVRQKLLDRRMRQQYRIKQICARSVYQKKSRKLAVTTYRDHQSGWSWFWSGFHQTFWPVLLAFLYTDFCNSSKPKPSLETNGPQDKSTEEDTAKELV